LPEHLARHAHVWRLVTRHIATYEEIRRYWDLNEVMRANELLDVQDDAEWMAHEDARAKSKRGRRR
jgi:hypothetical protein